MINGVIDRLSRALILRRLRWWRHSRIDFRLPEDVTVSAGDLASRTFDVVNVRHNRVFRRILFGGSTGVGEAYVDGEWSTIDLQGPTNRMLQDCDRVAWDFLASWPRRVLDFVGHNSLS